MANRLRVDAVRAAGLGPVSFELAGGDVTVLSGPSGAGKTRLLRAIVDLDPHAGEVRLDDISCDDFTPSAWRRAVGLAPAESAWWAVRVADHFERLDEPALAALDLPVGIDQAPVVELSTGERQRLALLRALALTPRVLLLDEPTANLDAANVSRVETLLDRFRRDTGATLLWVSHDRSQIVRLQARELRMRDGRLAGVE